MGIGGIIILIVFGLVIGVIARFLMPGRQPMGMLMTIALGVAGSFLGGWLGKQLHGEPFDGTQPAGWLGSIIGACLLLLVFGWWQKRNP
jgi:uncharacterized membrane protein YeaQ/YmgE (transglycosylase-associated protein family)